MSYINHWMKALATFKILRIAGILITLITQFITTEIFCQQAEISNVFPNGRPEVYFKFVRPTNVSISEISRIISIDSRRGDTIYAYANPSEFLRFQQFNITPELLTAPSLLTKAIMSSDTKGMQAWDSYPTYPAYVSMMQNFAATYPSLCHLDTIGTSQMGHLLLFLEISNHPRAIEAKPEFMYSSTMHGDEVTGYVLMLRLIDYLLSNYGTDSLVTRLVNNLHIWINPLANPDGTYLGGDNTVNGASRYLHSGWDPNRNFPDPANGPHPDGDTKYEKETAVMMNFMQKHHFVMSANFHGGDEVVNYPWDTWQKGHRDSLWLEQVSKEYADSAQHFGPGGYFTTVTNSGYVDGYEWYRVTGGRQDYMTYFMHGRESTIELDVYKTPPAADLPIYWTANYRSFLHYMEESTFSLHGIITDSVTGKPVRATILIPAHDADHSEAYSDSVTGYYTRLIAAGQYNFQISAPGYLTKMISGVSISNRQRTTLNIQLRLANYLPPVLRNDAGKIVDTLIIEMIPDSVKNICLHISDPEKQLAYIDTILSSNSNVTLSYASHDSCLVLTPAPAYEGKDTMKLVLCDTGIPSLCDTFIIVANTNKANDIIKVPLSNSLKIFPNPFSSDLTIQLKNSEGIVKSIVVYDITGKDCLKQKFTSSNEIISTSHLRQGLYLVQIFSGNNLIGSQKLVKLE